MNKKIFYYNFKPFNAWLVFNILLTLAIILCFLSCNKVYLYFQMYVIAGVTLFSWIAWYYKYIHPQIMAIITEEYIKLDHTNPLKWSDIAYAEERDVYCCCKTRRIIVLVPHDGINYKYNWLQKHNAWFTPFSIPLYGLLSKEDETEISTIIDKKIGIRRLK